MSAQRLANLTVVVDFPPPDSSRVS